MPGGAQLSDRVEHGAFGPGEPDLLAVTVVPGETAREANSTPLDAIVVSTLTMSIETAGHGLQCLVDDVVPERTGGNGSWLCECENPSNQQA